MRSPKLIFKEQIHKKHKLVATIAKGNFFFFYGKIFSPIYTSFSKKLVGYAINVSNEVKDVIVVRNMGEVWK
jgi:hypothetical protein